MIMTPKIALLACGVGVLAVSTAVVYNAGAVYISVQEKDPKGTHLRLAVPGVTLPVAAMLVPKAKLREHSEEIQKFLPAIQAATDELRRCPDTVLVEVRDHNEHVKIAKQGDALVIDVNDDGETVHVSVPLTAVAYTASRLTVDGPTM